MTSIDNINSKITTEWNKRNSTTGMQHLRKLKISLIDQKMNGIIL